MKYYIRPITEITGLKASTYILAGSGDGSQNQVVNNGGGVHIGGNSQGSTAQGDANGNVEDMAKDFNAWSTWDED